jgi:aryl-alcohol dehydrogenase-like predicted oxidoreductase
LLLKIAGRYEETLKWTAKSRPAGCRFLSTTGQDPTFARRFPAGGALSCTQSAKRLPEGFKKYFTDGKPNPEWYRRLEAVRAVLTSDGRTLAQGALAWVWARSPRAIPIPGFKTVRQVEENAAAVQFGLLKPEQMREIEGLLGRVA